jgi:hypothetical protein
MKEMRLVGNVREEKGSRAENPSACRKGQKGARPEKTIPIWARAYSKQNKTKKADSLPMKPQSTFDEYRLFCPFQKRA